MSFKHKLIIVASLGLLVLAADQASKIWARGALVAPGEFVVSRDSGKKLVIPVMGDRPGVEFRLSFNKGAAFGMFGQTTGSRVFLSLIGLMALGLIFYLLRRPESDSKIFVYALGLVAGGAVGNLIDRVAFGQVTDFIWVWLTPQIKILWPWPAWNIADAGLVVGVLLMVPAMIFQKSPEEDDEDGEDKGGGDEKADGKTTDKGAEPKKNSPKGGAKKGGGKKKSGKKKGGKRK